jgi:hypothetical protein
MLEFIASSFINKFVGKYVENITASQFKKLILLNFSLESKTFYVTFYYLKTAKAQLNSCRRHSVQKLDFKAEGLG